MDIKTDLMTPDKCLILAGRTYVLDAIIRAATCVPAPCPQLWWRLEKEYLEEDLVSLEYYSCGFQPGWYYILRIKGKPFPVHFFHKDRSTALLKACIAKAKQNKK
jgi:hypothetical protein